MLFTTFLSKSFAHLKLPSSISLPEKVKNFFKKSISNQGLVLDFTFKVLTRLKSITDKTDYR